MYLIGVFACEDYCLEINASCGRHEQKQSVKRIDGQKRREEGMGELPERKW